MAKKVVAIKVEDLPVECLGDRIVPAGNLSASLRDVRVRADQNNSGVTFKVGDDPCQGKGPSGTTLKKVGRRKK